MFEGTEFCLAHQCVVGRVEGELEEALDCCRAQNDLEERILCAAQAQGMEPGIGICWVAYEWPDWSAVSISEATCERTTGAEYVIDPDTLDFLGRVGWTTGPYTDCSRPDAD